MARRKLKCILHLRSPLSSVESQNSHRVVGSTAKVVPPMKVGTKEDDVLVMDAVPIQVCTRPLFSTTIISRKFLYLETYSRFENLRKRFELLLFSSISVMTGEAKNM